MCKISKRKRNFLFLLFVNLLRFFSICSFLIYFVIWYNNFPPHTFLHVFSYYWEITVEILKTLISIIFRIMSSCFLSYKKESKSKKILENFFTYVIKLNDNSPIQMLSSYLQLIEIKLVRLCNVFFFL